MKRLAQIALLLALLAVCIPAYANWALVNHTTGCIGSATPCNLTVPATTAGNLLVGTAASLGTAFAMTSITGGTSVHPVGCGTASAGANRGTDVAYVLSATGGSTTITFTGNNNFDGVALDEYSSNGASFDVCATRLVTAAAANLAGVSAGTLAGTNDVILQYGAFTGSASSPCPNSAASPGGAGSFVNGNTLACGLINTTNNAAGTYTNTSSTAALGAIAFKEAAGGAATIGVDKRRKYERLDEENY